MDIVELFENLTDLSPARRQELLLRYQTDSLTDEDAMELHSHFLKIAAASEEQLAIIANLEKKGGKKAA